MLDDLQIIQLFFDRSETAIAAVAEKYGAACTAIARNILASPLDAEECVNDAYLAAWNTIPPQRPSPLRAYLLRIVRNLSITRYHANTAAKRNSSYDVALDELEGCLCAPDGVEDTLNAKELSRVLNDFLAKLPKRDRVLFLRRYWYGESIPVLSVRFGLTENNTCVRLHRIRRKLKQHLRKEGFAV